MAYLRWRHGVCRLTEIRVGPLTQATNCESKKSLAQHLTVRFETSGIRLRPLHSFSCRYHGHVSADTKLGDGPVWSTWSLLLLGHHLARLPSLQHSLTHQPPRGSPWLCIVHHRLGPLVVSANQDNRAVPKESFFIISLYCEKSDSGTATAIFATLSLPEWCSKSFPK